MSSSLPRRTLLYVEPESDGHHLALYAAAIWPKMIAEGWSISWLTSTHALRSEVAGRFVARFGPDLEVHAYDLPHIPSAGGRPFAWLKYQYRHWRWLNREVPRLVRSSSVDAIFLPWLNYCDRACGLLGLPAVDVPISALHMHISIHEPAAPTAGWLHRASRSLTRRTMARLYGQAGLKQVAVILETFAEFARTSRFPGWEKVTYVPDMGSLDLKFSPEESRTSFTLRPDDTVVLAFGALTGRKGVNLLLAAVASLADRSRLVIFLAGQQDAEVRGQVAAFQQSACGAEVRTVILDAFVSSDDESRLFAAADIVWVGYPGFMGSSGVLTQAGCAGLPVIAGEQGEIGRDVQHSRCGLTCDLMDKADVAGTLQTLILARELRTELGANGRKRARRHSPEIFGANIYQLVTNSVGSAETK